MRKENIQHEGGFLMDVQEVANRFQVHPSTVRRWIQRGRLRATRIEDPRGAHYWIDEADLNLQKAKEVTVVGKRHTEGGAPSSVFAEVAASCEITSKQALMTGSMKSVPMEPWTTKVQAALVNQSLLQQRLLQEISMLRDDIQTLLTEMAATKELVDLQEERYRKERDQQLMQVMQTLQRNKQPRRPRLWNRG